MSDSLGLPVRSERGRERRRTLLWGTLLALVAAVGLAGLWFLRPMAGAGSWQGRTLCGSLGAGSAGDGVEESGLESAGGGGIRLAIADVNLLGRFHGTLSGGRFGAGQPVRGWLRARGFAAIYEAGATVRGSLLGSFGGNVLQGVSREIMMVDGGGDPRLLVTSAAFRLEPCDGP